MKSLTYHAVRKLQVFFDYFILSKFIRMQSDCSCKIMCKTGRFIKEHSFLQKNYTKLFENKGKNVVERSLVLFLPFLQCQYGLSMGNEDFIGI